MGSLEKGLDNTFDENINIWDQLKDIDNLSLEDLNSLWKKLDAEEKTIVNNQDQFDPGNKEDYYKDLDYTRKQLSKVNNQIQTLKQKEVELSKEIPTIQPPEQEKIHG